MRKSRFTEEQIIGILAEQERGEATGDVCRRHGVSTTTFYKWKAKFGGMVEFPRFCGQATALRRKRPHAANTNAVSARVSRADRRPASCGTKP